MSEYTKKPDARGDAGQPGSVDDWRRSITAEDRRYMQELASRTEMNMTRGQRQTQPKDAARKEPAPHRRAAAASRQAPTRKAGRGKKRQKRKRKKSPALRIAAFVMIFVLLLVLVVYGVVQSKIDGKGGQAGKLDSALKNLPEYKGEEVSFLLCGIDYDNEGADGYDSQTKIGRTDMILYVRYNIVEQKVNILQLPRDTFVGEEVQTGGNYKINSVYYFAPEGERMKALQRVLHDQFGLKIDFYITLDMDAVKAIVDHMGYIAVHVPQDLSDPENPSSFLAEGWHNLKSEQVEFLLRNRHTPGYAGQGDIARLRTQQSFYSAMFREFKQLTPKDLFMWLNIFLPYMKTDAGLNDLIGIAMKALKLDSAAVTFARPACGGVQYKGEWLVSLLQDDMADLLNTYFRPGGEAVAAADLKMYTLPISEEMGVVPTEVKSMADVQAQAPPMDA